MTDQTQQRLARLESKAEIRELLERYCRGVDRLDPELIRGVYWPGARDDHGSFKGPGDEFADFVVDRLGERYDATMHLLGQSLIELYSSGDLARAETYFLAFHRREDEGEGRTVLDTAAGRYVDELARRDGHWRLSSRTVVMEWSDRNADLRMDTWPQELFVRGVRDRNDLAYGARPGDHP